MERRKFGAPPYFFCFLVFGLGFAHHLGAEVWGLGITAEGLVFRGLGAGLIGCGV